MTMLQEAFDELLVALLTAIQLHYGERLVTVAVFGSVGRRAMRYDSDVDLLIIAHDLPQGRIKRIEEFDAVEEAMTDLLRDLAKRGVYTAFSPILKIPEEVQAGSLLFLDMIEDARLLYDRGGFFARQLDRLRARLAELGAKRIWRGNAWYWDLKPDYKPGEVFEL